jgi:hypothetical protein
MDIKQILSERKYYDTKTICFKTAQTAKNRFGRN